MKKAILGGLLLIIGLAIISPLDDVAILLPLATYWDMPELILAVNCLAVLCLFGAVLLLGTSSVTGPLHKHWKMLIVSIIILVLVLYWYVI